MNRRALASVAGTLLLLAALMPTAVIAKSADAGRFTKDGIYIVQLAEMPVVAYKGDIKGLKATAPGQAKKIDPTSAAVVAYSDFLKGRHDAKVKAVGGNKVYDYVYTYNGFAARLTAAQANKLTHDAGVVAISPDEIRTADTSSTPDFLGLTAPGGLWDQLGGVKSAGEDIIIGDVDSGIWPESLSFSDRVDKHTGQPSNAPGAKLVYHQVPGWHGKCVSGEDFKKTSDCNEKLIGAQYFNASLGGDAGVDATKPWEFNSAARLQRPRHAHGVHGRRQLQHPDHRTRGRVRLDQRHGAAGADRDVQGPVVDRGCVDGERLHLRPRRCHRCRRPRRRRRHQLLDQRHVDELRRPGRDLVPVRRGRRHLRRRVRRQQRPDEPARSRTRHRGRPRSPRARTTVTARARSRSATARPTRAPRWRPRSARRP